MELEAAHAKAVIRGNPSTVAFLTTINSNSDFAKATIAGLSTFGLRHAPIPEIVAVLTGKVDYRKLNKVPGFGSSFVKGEFDPDLKKAFKLLKEQVPDVYKKIREISKYLKEDRGKNLYPNIACLTAAVAIGLGHTEVSAISLLISIRVNIWGKLVANQLVD